ncbi:MAG TPA: hypothetical protein VIG47_01615, partial [Gemmatimonadaceae bacterium]
MRRYYAISLCLLSAFALLGVPVQGQGMTLARMPLPGTPAYVKTAKDIIDVHYRIIPNNAAEAGLFENSAIVPSFSPKTVKTLTARLDRDMAALRASHWRNWSVDRQIDARYVYAIAQDAKRQLSAERMYEYRPAQWLEPVANTFIALLSYAPQRTDIQQKIVAQIPAMVTEMQTVCTHPTKRNADTAAGIIDALVPTIKALPQNAERDKAIASLSAYKAHLASLTNLPEFRVIGNANYAWRLKHVELLPWNPTQLRNLAMGELTRVDAQLATLKPKLKPTPAPTQAQLEQAKALDQQSILNIYDTIEQKLRAKVDHLGIITVPAGVGPIKSRVTPDAMVALGGDGGSMNNPPTYWNSNVGWWNVEHFNPKMSEQDRIDTVVRAEDFDVTGEGPYAVHEG